MDEGYLNISGKKIWYCVYGREKSSTSLLVVHGGPGFSSITDVICDFGEERPVYFYDQLGSTRSAAADSPDYYSVENFVQELDEVRRELKLKEVILMGHSWGAH